MTRDNPRGFDVLNDPRLNKSTAFTPEERDRLGLRGLLPPAVSTQNTQIQRVLENMRRKNSDIERFIFLQSLAGRNERLFYKVVMEHVDEVMPFIYTPTVGQACQEFAHIFREPKGLYVTANDQGDVAALLRNWPYRDVKIVVVTDGERILGLGDLGANGMGIPIGKLSLYTALAGIPPEQTLPIMLDVGTENPALREDPLYLGLRQPRLRGEPYLELTDELMHELQQAFPGCLVQFEDFATPNAYLLLERYRDRYLCFNDDIQGTAAVALAGLYASSRVTGKALEDMTFMFLGAGSAATGIADLIVAALMEHGVDEQTAYQRVWFVDLKGLLVASRSHELLPHNLPYAHDHAPAGFLEAIDGIKPDVLIGATGAPGTFTQDVIRRMAEHHRQPVVFALSNPTARAECTAAEAFHWSDGRVVFASGSPFPPVEHEGRLFHPGQANNAHVFPGIGLGVVACGAHRVSTAMFLEAARTLAAQVSEHQLNRRDLFPELTDIRSVSRAIASAVASEAFRDGLADPAPPEDFASHLDSIMYVPGY